MQQESFVKKLDSEKIAYQLGVPMSEHTTFKIGGNADIMVIPDDTEQLKKTLQFASENNVSTFILGRGSNLLISDKGIEGAVINMSRIAQIKLEGNTVICSAGLPLSRLCTFAAENSLSGLEFAFGIPGSVGGALFMNAGAYGGEMSQVAVSAEYINKNGEIVEITKDDMNLGYRTSTFKSSGYVITEIKLLLKPDNKESIRAKMDDYMERRRSKQPLEYPSAGSTFKRPEGYYAGALIEKNGFKGKGVGAAQVSEKHAGFIINKGGATAYEVRKLIEEIQQTVLNNDGVKLETEVIFAGR